MACNLITFYDNKTEHRELKRKQKKIYQKRLSINAHCFQVQQSIVTNTSKYNLAKGRDLKKPIKILFYKNNVFCQNFNENKKDT